MGFIINIKEFNKKYIEVENYENFLFAKDHLRDAYTLLKNAYQLKNNENIKKNLLCLLELLIFKCNERTEVEKIHFFCKLSSLFKKLSFSDAELDNIKNLFECLLYLSYLNAFKKIKTKETLKICKINFIQSLTLFEYFTVQTSLFPLYSFSIYDFFSSEEDFVLYSCLIDPHKTIGYHTNNQKTSENNVFFLKEKPIQVINEAKKIIFSLQNIMNRQKNVKRFENVC